LFRPERLDDVLNDLESSMDGEGNSVAILHRFWRTGKRHGRRNIETQPIAELLSYSVSAVGAKLAEEFLKLRMERISAQKGLEERLRHQEAREEEFPFVIEPEIDDEGLLSDDRRIVSAVGAPRRNDARSLEQAANVLDRNREKQARVAEHAQIQERNAKILSRYQSALSARETYLSELQSLREQIIKLEQEVSELPRIYEQKFLKVKERGSVYWARFCDGFDAGRSHIHRPLRLSKKGRVRALERYEAKRSVPRPTAGIKVQTPSVFSAER
jgi:hypothetical protein